MQQIGENEFRTSREKDPKEWRIPTEGLNKIEYASIQAMNGLTCNHELLKDIMSNNSEFKNLLFHEAIATASIKIAEEVLKQLENNK